jgi:glycosyltransferase involved in cell wall biosynthesis
MVIQPVVASYRLSFFNGLADHFGDVIVYANLHAEGGFSKKVAGRFKVRHTDTVGSRSKIYYQTKILKDFLIQKPRFVFIAADPRAVHFWCLLIICKLTKTPIFSHGQGLFRKPHPTIFNRLVYRALCYLSTRYLCYAKISLDSLLSIGIRDSRLAVLDNFIVNKYPVSPESKTKTVNGLLFIGRLRDGCNLDLLFSAMVKLRARGKTQSLDVIGSGEHAETLTTMAANLDLDVTFHGDIYDDKLISEISKRSSIGVYPGDAGLSVVHYMSLSLIPIVHDRIDLHMGPEPSYIVNEVNGYTFQRGCCLSLAEVIVKAGSCDVSNIASSAFGSYKKISFTSMHHSLIRIISGDIDVIG